MTSSLVQVDVSVQDHFFTHASADTTEGLEGDRPSSPIADEEWETWFRHWLEHLHPDLSPNQYYELSLRLTDDAEIQALNAQYRYKNQPTDVLAFAALEVDYPQLDTPDETAPLYLGDIVISVETAQTQAIQFGHSLGQELAWLAAHALLHLLGWDHPDEASLVRMLKQQESLLQTIGLTINYHQVEKSTRQEYLDTEVQEV